MRYFYATVGGHNKEKRFTFHTFSFYTNDSYPSHTEIIEKGYELLGKLENGILISITELSEQDYESFTSEQVYETGDI